MNSKGFTLVELAIVMIIIGLLIGGILKGQELIKSAELSRAVTNLKSMEAAIQTFKSEYRGLPGDLKNASTRINPAAVNGNGDGKLDYAEGPPAFQHLSMVNLIDGTYDNSVGPSGEWVPGKTVPRGPADQSGYWFAYVLNHHGFTGNIIEYALAESGAMMGSVLTPNEAQRIDIKIDDNSPTTGRLLGFNGYDIQAQGKPYRCTTSGNAMDANEPRGSAQYNLPETSTACRIMYTIK